MTEDEMVGWHHWLDGHEFEQAPGVGDGPESLICCNPWGCKELDTTEQNWTDWVLASMSSIPYVFLQWSHLDVFQLNFSYFLVKPSLPQLVPSHGRVCSHYVSVEPCVSLMGPFPLPGGNSLGILQTSPTQYLDPRWVFPCVFPLHSSPVPYWEGAGNCYIPPSKNSGSQP